MRSFPLILTIILTVIPWSGVYSTEITTLTGSTTTSKIRSITPNGRVSIAGKDDPINLQQIRSIHTGRTIEKLSATTPRMYLVGGGRLYVHNVSFDFDAINFEWIGNRRDLPLRYSRALILSSREAENSSAARITRLIDQKLDKDRALARKNGKLVAVSCFVSALDSDTLTVDYEGEERNIARNSLTGIVLARTAEPPNRRGHCFITLTDGSTIWGDIVQLKKNKLTISAFPDVNFDIPWKRVARLKVNSTKMVYVSELEPVSVEQKAIVTYPWKYQRDRDVMGNDLELGGTKYDRGLGVHSECHLTYSMKGGYDTFITVIGIDDDTGQRGDCLFQVYGNGKKLYEQRVKGTDAPRRINVDISGNNRIRLSVIPGKNFDIADNANWCDARFIKQ